MLLLFKVRRKSDNLKVSNMATKSFLLLPLKVRKNNNVCYCNRRMSDNLKVSNIVKENFGIASKSEKEQRFLL